MDVYPSINPSQFNQHIKGEELKKKLPTKLFKSYFKFGFVCNPYDWQVSLYHFMLKDVTHHQHKLVKNLGNFNNYIHWRVNNEVRFQKVFFMISKVFCLLTISAN